MITEKLDAGAAENILPLADSDYLEGALVKKLAEKGKKIASAESCTGGLVAKRITNISGSSGVLDGSIVAYANKVKEKFLGVPSEILATKGAVSEETAIEMARGVRRLFDADIGVATTGIAGPTGGTAEKPVGRVYVAVSSDGFEEVRELTVGNGNSPREFIRHISASHALELAIKAAERTSR